MLAQAIASPYGRRREYAPGGAGVVGRRDRGPGSIGCTGSSSRNGTDIPAGLINDISLLPNVEKVRPGAIVSTELPPPRAEAMGGGPIVVRAMRCTSTKRTGTAAASRRDGRGARYRRVPHHPELRGRLEPGRDFVDIIDGQRRLRRRLLGLDESPEDEVGHGTHVAGIIVGAGVAMPEGIVPRCRLLPVRVLGAMKQGARRVGAGLVDNINAGVKWAIDQGADVINMSLGVQHTGGGLPHEEVVDYARRKGVTIVAASGNDGLEGLYYPGAFPSVIAVGAEDDWKAGRGVFDLWPAGVVCRAWHRRLQQLSGKRLRVSSGTSHAAPFVSGRDRAHEVVREDPGAAVSPTARPRTC